MTVIPGCTARRSYGEFADTMKEWATSPYDPVLNGMQVGVACSRKRWVWAAAGVARLAHSRVAVQHSQPSLRLPATADVVSGHYHDSWLALAPAPAVGH